MRSIGAIGKIRRAPVTRAARPRAAVQSICGLLLTLCAGAAAAVLAATALPASADTWQFEPVVVTEEYVFDDVRIMRAVDGTEDQQYPEWTVAIFVDDELRAFYGGVSFEHIVASPDKRSFIGISNNGLPGTALVVFDRRGALLLERKHDPQVFDYCERTDTLVRRWYDGARPELRFEPDDHGNSGRLTVRGCAGNLIDLGPLVGAAIP